MLKVGLTGGAGSGKSTATHFFAELGAPTLDADLAARDVTAAGSPALDAIKEHFGSSFILEDGSLNRKALGSLIFGDADQKKWLEQLLHPLIRDNLKARIAELDAPYCIIEIQLLAEAEGIDYIDRACVVDATDENRIARLKSSRHLSDEDIQKIFASQCSRDVRLAIADDIIDNNQNLDHLKQQVQALHECYSQSK